MAESDKLLIRQAYMDAEAFAVRQRTHDIYSVPRLDFPRWALSRQHNWRGDEWVLDINPANGTYFEAARELWPQGRYVAADLSYDILKTAYRHPLADDIQMIVHETHRLPFANHCFDVILANHMLHHIPHLEATLAELHRILKPGGVLLAATHSQFTMSEFDTLTRRALTLLGHPPLTHESVYGRFIEGFSLENGAVTLARHFRAVARYEMPSALVFKEARPVIEYLNSSRPAREPALPDRLTWEDFIAIMADQIRRLINHFGELTVNKLSGVLLATDHGSFARSYFKYLDNNR